MGWNVLWAALIAAIVGLIMNAMIAGILGQLVKQTWADIWMRLNGLMLMMGFVGMLGYGIGIWPPVSFAAGVFLAIQYP